MSNDTLSTHSLRRALASAEAAGVSTGRLRLEVGLAASDPDVTVHRDAHLSPSRSPSPSPSPSRRRE